jgi:hypothetical protein
MRHGRKREKEKTSGEEKNITRRKQKRRKK